MTPETSTTSIERDSTQIEAVGQKLGEHAISILIDNPNIILGSE